MNGQSDSRTHGNNGAMNVCESELVRKYFLQATVHEAIELIGVVRARRVSYEQPIDEKSVDLNIKTMPEQQMRLIVHIASSASALIAYSTTFEEPPEPGPMPT